MTEEDLKKKADEIKEANKESGATAADKEKGDKPKASPYVDQAHAAAERMEKANEKREELLGREEEIVARRLLAGQSVAGEPIKEKTQDEKDQELADEMVKLF